LTLIEPRSKIWS